MNVRQRMDFLIDEINKQDKLYYQKNAPIISDSQYDALVQELIALERENPDLIRKDSPTQKVSGNRSSTFAPIKHLAPMLSLDNTYSKDEVVSWYDRIVKNIEAKNIEVKNLDFVVEPKVDGLSLSLLYVDGKLSTAATRGDGEIGEDVTENAKTIKDIAQVLETRQPPSLFDIRGEVYMDKQTFESLNADLTDGQKKFANERNAASGSLRQKNVSITAHRNLKFFVHSFGKMESKKVLFSTHWDFLQYVKKCGFKLQENIKLFKNIDEILNFIDEMATKKDSLGYEIDGLVIKVNEFSLQNEIGYTNKSPKWAVAYKFAAKQAITKIISISVAVGRTGVVTPIANLEPVSLAGVTISHATLHNFEEIQRLNVNAGDEVLIERAGEVIPKIIKVVEKRSEDFFKPPQECPSCKSKLIKEKEEEVAYRCINPDCPAQFERHVLHFASKNALDIDGLGKAVVKNLIAKDKIKTLADIYKLGEKDFLEIELFKEKKASNLIEAIQKSKMRPLSKLIFAFGIRHVGQRASDTLADVFGNMDALIAASFEELIKIDEIGDVLALSLKEFFAQAQVIKMIETLKAAGLNMTQPRQNINSAKFLQKTFVLTGELEKWTRQQATEIIKSEGGKVVNSVSKNTDFVLAGKNAGSKLSKAKELNIKILTQEDFEKLL
ncbi:MAG: NAD-dependent DNA ligase LigA [Elusimicrobiota bacterium]|jgi:DNA ligase (NAD+)|nr:NAD-dependent DNA ligase LigA [Elusimicrobiota bacterium]